MSVPASNPAKNSTNVDADSPTLELVKLCSRWQEGLMLFLQELQVNGDTSFFHPHPTDEETIRKLAVCKSLDLYYLLIEGNNVIGYGLLRGWDEGYEIPSLGIAIHPSERGSGLGRLLMNFLHVLAIRRGASKIRLRVLKNNNNAIDLYRGLGYIFEKDINNSDFLIGFKILKQ